MARVRKKQAMMLALLLTAFICVAGCTLPANLRQNVTPSIRQEISAAVRAVTTSTKPERVLLFANSTDADSVEMVATAAKLPWHVEVHYIDQEPYWTNLARFMYSVAQTSTLTVILYDGPFEHAAFVNIVGVHSADDIVAQVDATLDH